MTETPHNDPPARAVDLAPWPERYLTTKAFDGLDLRRSSQMNRWVDEKGLRSAVYGTCTIFWIPVSIPFFFIYLVLRFAPVPAWTAYVALTAFIAGMIMAIIRLATAVRVRTPKQTS